jgi:DNA-binding response OmpR family regulator
MAAITLESSALADDAPHLLVVDDDRRIRDLLSRFLLSEGYRVTTAESAAMARAKLEGLRFDLLILDVMMPGETGFEFARTLRASSTVPILMLTARGEAESRIEGLELGADDYVGKPFEPRELSLRIANILKRARPAVAATRSSISPIVSARCCACWRRCRARPCRGWRLPAPAAAPAPSANAPSTCRSTGCAARSSAIRPIRCWCRRCAVLAIAW